MSSTEETANVIIDNRTDLPDEQVQAAVETYWVENSSLTGIANATFQTYANSGGSLLARREYRTPGNVFDEIKLARDLAERDDDVSATIGVMQALAFGSGMEHQHEDEITLSLFNKVAANGNFDAALKNIYREYIIASQFTTVSLFTRETYTFTPEGGKRQRSQSVSSPLIGVLHSENIRVLGNDLFGNAELAYKPDTQHEGDLKKWLDEWFNPKTTAARKNELRSIDPVSAVLFTERIERSSEEHLLTETVYRLNPRMAHRTTMPKGSWSYPRPLLTRDFALLEAKRLLNIMDYSLLQGGANFIVVAKKGTDERPANNIEVQQLQETVRRASKTGVIVGDHRLSFEIITPNMEWVLNAEKRKMLGRRLAMALLRIPELPDEGTEGVKTSVEMLSRVIEGDRLDIKRHIENKLYSEVEKRNSRVFNTGVPKLWFPKIILQGTQYFTDFVLKLRDRGDIPRKWAVEAGGFDYEAGLAERKREKARGDDRVLAPAAVPFSSPNAGPQDNNSGRPPGASPNNGSGNTPSRSSQDPASPRRTITRNAGETVTAIDHEEHGIMRVGEQTWDLLTAYEDQAELGRMTPIEERALEERAAIRQGPVAIIPVNVNYEVEQARVIRLTKGFSVVVGKRVEDDALVAKALCFREPEFSTAKAEETAIRYGFSPGAIEEPNLLETEPGKETAALPTIVVQVGEQDKETGKTKRVRKVPVRDPETQRILYVDEVEIDPDDVTEDDDPDAS
jgi:hypothetical protein